jgi:H+/gluconate symporter-like permease
MSNQEIPKEILEALNKDTEFKTKNASHIQRINLWSMYVNFAHFFFPALLKYSGLVLSIYATYKTIKSDTITILIDFATKQDNWIMLLILCLTFVTTLFIQKKFK